MSRRRLFTFFFLLGRPMYYEKKAIEKRISSQGMPLCQRDLGFDEEVVGVFVDEETGAAGRFYGVSCGGRKGVSLDLEALG